jgi:hypothetical protein
MSLKNKSLLNPENFKITLSPKVLVAELEVVGAVITEPLPVPEEVVPFGMEIPPVELLKTPPEEIILSAVLVEEAEIGVEAPEVAVVAPVGGVLGTKMDSLTTTGVEDGIGGIMIVPPPPTPPPPPP